MTMEHDSLSSEYNTVKISCETNNLVLRYSVSCGFNTLHSRMCKITLSHIFLSRVTFISSCLWHHYMYSVSVFQWLSCRGEGWTKWLPYDSIIIIIIIITTTGISWIWPIKIRNNLQPHYGESHYTHFPALCLRRVVVNKDGYVE